MADRMTAVAKLPDAIRALAEVIRKHGTCAPAALDHVADELTAALSPAELGGVEDYVDPLDVFLSQGVDDVPCLQVPGRVLARFVPGSWDSAYEMFSGNTPTPRAAEAVTDEMVERAIEAMRDSHGFLNPPSPYYMRAALTAALTPPSAKGE